MRLSSVLGLALALALAPRQWHCSPHPQTSRSPPKRRPLQTPRHPTPPATSLFGSEPRNNPIQSLSPQRSSKASLTTTGTWATSPTP